MQVQLGKETLIAIICENDDDRDHVCDDPDHVRDDHQTQHHTNRDEILMMILTTAMMVLTMIVMILTMAMMIMIKPEFQSSMTADLRRSKSFVRSKRLEEI